MAEWHPPVFFGTRPILFEGKLYIDDRSDGKIKVYSATSSLKDPDFLWEAAGFGEGPGEIPRDSNINNITVHPETGQVWVSHRRGILVFEAQGKFFRQMKRTHNKSWLVVREDYIGMTSPNFLQQRSLLTLARRGERNPIWELASLKGIPLTGNSVFIEEINELYFLGNHFVSYIGSLGQLAVANPEGDLKMLVDLPQTLPGYIQAESFLDTYEFGKSAFQLYPFPYGYSGIVKKGNHLLVMTLHYCGGVRTEKRQYVKEKTEDGYYRMLKILALVNFKTGALEGRFFHEQFLQPMYLLEERDDVLTFFNLETGDEIYRVGWKNLEAVEKLTY